MSETDPLRAAVIKLAFENEGLRPHLLPLVKEGAEDSADVAYRYIHTGDGLVRELGRRIKQVEKAFADGVRQLKGLERVGSEYIEAPRMLDRVVAPPIRDLRQFLNDVVDQVDAVTK